VVRRLEYIETYLESIEKGFSHEEIESELTERKRGFEREKIMAVGRGNPYRKGIERTARLAKQCQTLSKKLCFTVNVSSELVLTERGESYLRFTKLQRKQLLCEYFTKTYPHLGVLVSVLNRQPYKTVTLPLQNKPPFRPLALSCGLDIGQVGFDTLRDLATGIGVVNWYYSGEKLDRRQHVYLICHVSDQKEGDYRVFHREKWVNMVSNKVELPEFKKTLWYYYMELTDGVPGAPVFYSALRELVCDKHRVSDSLFDLLVSDLVEYDEDYLVVWSEGVLPYRQDSASMLKSLPPKTDYGNYIVYLKIQRRRSYE